MSRSRSISRLAALAISVATLAACQSSDVSRTLGAECTVSDDCDNRCLQPGSAYPAGLCTVTCEIDDDCPGTADCVIDEGGVCLYSCADDLDCQFLGDDWTCQQDSSQGSAGTVMVCLGT